MTKPKTGAQLKKAVKATKRAKGEDTDDSEDDFKPVKAAAKPRAPAKPRVKKETATAKSSIVPSTTTSAAPSPTKRGFSTVASEASDTEIKPPAPKKANTTQTNGTKKSVKEAIMELDDDSDDERE